MGKRSEETWVIVLMCVTAYVGGLGIGGVAAALFLLTR